MYDYSINEMTLDHNYFEKMIFSNDDYTIPFRPISNVSSNFEINNYYEDLSKKDSNNLELSVKKMNEINDSKIFEDFSINKDIQNVKTNKDNKHNKKNSQNDTNSKTFLGKKHKHSIEKIFDRKHQIDNFSQKFLKAVNDWIISKINNKIKKLLNDKFHPPNYDIITHNSNNRENVLNKFRESSAPMVLISPSMNEGVDLPGDLCRFQIIFKLPYLPFEDPWVKKRKNLYAAMKFTCRKRCDIIVGIIKIYSWEIKLSELSTCHF